MATTLGEIKGWFEQGIAMKATHFIVVHDTFDFNDYPVYVMPEQDVHKVEERVKKDSWLRVMEVYKLSMSWGDHLNQKRVFNY